jgi:hypothetical protein
VRRFIKGQRIIQRGAGAKESVMKVTMMGKESTMVSNMIQGGGDIGGVSHLNMDAMAVVPKFIKPMGGRMGGKVRDRIIPLVIVSQDMVKNAGVPLKLTGKEDMGKGVPFGVSVRAHGHTGKTILDGEGNNITIKCGDTLLATDMHRFVIDITFVMFKLARRVDGIALAKQSILMEDGNDGSSMGVHISAHSADVNGIELVVINTLDVNLPVSFGNSADICASDTTIAPTINQRMGVKAAVSGHGVGNVHFREPSGLGCVSTRAGMPFGR